MKKIEANDTEAQSADIVADNLSQLKALFPEAFAEGKVQFEALRQLLGGAVDESDEKYGFNWHGKRRARQIALTPSTGTLRPCPEESVDWEITQNLMIEGDNLEVLKLLQKSYAGKVKMIYIDPPYNTGHDFVYPDNFRDSIGNYLEVTGQLEGGAKISANTDASGRFHTDWLNMMYPRLRLARSLLRSDGLIYISIDDGEVAGLRLMLNEIFGEENFLANIVWQKKYSPQNDEKYFSDSHEHLVVYAKSKESFQIGLLPRTDEANARYKNPDNDPRGAWKSSDLTRQEYRARDDYEIISPKTGKGFRPPKGNSWGRPKEVVEALIKDNRIWFGPDGNAVPSLKRFLSEVKQGITPQTIWYREEVGDTQEGKKTIKEFFGDVSVFETAKPHRLIQRAMLTGAVKNNDIVLDFFAGSGTTGHAVMMQNFQDGGNRRFILVQLPEPMDRDDFPTISALVRERLRRVAKKMKSENPLFAGDAGFRAFKLDRSNIRDWNPEHQDLAKTLLDHHEHIVEGRTEADIVYELLLKLGLDLCVPMESRVIAGKTISAVGGGVLMLCLAEKIPAEKVEGLASGIVAWHAELAPAGDATVVFRDSAFADDVAKTNMAAILAQNGLENVRSL